MEVKTLVVGSMQTNCYLLFDENSRDAYIVDPGDDSEYITSQIMDLELKPLGIIATHGHFDHVAASLAVKTAYGVPFLMHPGDQFLLNRMKSTAEYFLGTYTDPAPIIDIPLTQSHHLTIGSELLSIVSVPGHTPGSVCVYAETSKILLVGDLVFSDFRVGRTDRKYAKKTDLWDSIRLISALPKDTLVLPGHGDATTIANVGKMLYH